MLLLYWDNLRSCNRSMIFIWIYSDSKLDYWSYPFCNGRLSRTGTNIDHGLVFAGCDFSHLYGAGIWHHLYYPCFTNKETKAQKGWVTCQYYAPELWEWLPAPQTHTSSLMASLHPSGIRTGEKHQAFPYFLMSFDTFFHGPVRRYSNWLLPPCIHGWIWISFW